MARSATAGRASRQVASASSRPRCPPVPPLRPLTSKRAAGHERGLFCVASSSRRPPPRPRSTPWRHRGVPEKNMSSCAPPRCRAGRASPSVARTTSSTWTRGTSTPPRSFGRSTRRLARAPSGARPSRRTYGAPVHTARSAGRGALDASRARSEAPASEGGLPARRSVRSPHRPPRANASPALIATLPLRARRSRRRSHRAGTHEHRVFLHRFARLARLASPAVRGTPAITTSPRSTRNCSRLTRPHRTRWLPVPPRRSTRARRAGRRGGRRARPRARRCRPGDHHEQRRERLPTVEGATSRSG